MEPITSVTAEQLTRALGEAAIRMWSNLPQDVQNHLFQEAATSQGESTRPHLAVFLHDKHSRTADQLGEPAGRVTRPKDASWQLGSIVWTTSNQMANPQPGN
jgi:hypothetical protein